MKVLNLIALLVCMFVLGVEVAQAESALPLSVEFTDEEKVLDEDLAKPLKILILITALSLLPALLIMMTSFTRIIIILSMLRQAIGLQNTPPNFVLISLALILTYFSMLPVIEEIQETAIKPYQAKQITEAKALDVSEEVMKGFMYKHTRPDDLTLMFELAEKPVVDNQEDIPLSVLVPAFLISELQLAFQIGFFIFLPFLLVDLVVASVLMSIGMIMVPPMTISLPIKVLIFVLVDGWSLLIQSLMSSY